MASAPLDPFPSFVSNPLPGSNSLRIVARVGTARWAVLLLAPAVALLRAEHPDETGAGLSATALLRVMEGLRIKAVGLHWYGGGTLAIDAADLGAAPVAADDGQPLIAPRWYEIVDVSEVANRDSERLS